MVYKHEEDTIGLACGIDKERYKEMTKDFAKQTLANKNKIMKYEMATSVVLEMIENMQWTTTEKLYMAYKYGDFTGDISSLAGIHDMLSRLDPSMVSGIVGVGIPMPHSKKKTGGFTPDDFANAKKKDTDKPDESDFSFVKEP